MKIELTTLNAEIIDSAPPVVRLSFGSEAVATWRIPEEEWWKLDGLEPYAGAKQEYLEEFVARKLAVLFPDRMEADRG